MLRSIIKKEFTHIWRDPQTLVIILLMPILMLMLYGYAITLEMRQIQTAIVDLSKTPQSREFIDRIFSTGFFRVTGADVPRDIEGIFHSRKAQCVLVIPESFATTLATELSSPVQLLIDASDPNAANFINTYIAGITLQFNALRNRGYALPFSVQSRVLYNPDLKSAYFFIPGLVAIIILLISTLLTSIAVVREKELGTMEQILVSPVRPSQIIIGKIIPYFALSFLVSVFILLFAHLWFDVPMRGSVLLLAFTFILYILTGLCFGLLISTATSSQQIAMMATLVITILPSFMLSGFIFPVRSMPVIFRGISLVIPATHFLKIIRSIVLKGTGVQDLLAEMAALLGFSTLLILIGIKKFRTRLE